MDRNSRGFVEDGIIFTVDDETHKWGGPTRWLWWEGPLTYGRCDSRGTHVSICTDSGFHELRPDLERDGRPSEPEEEGYLRELQMESMRQIIDNLSGLMDSKRDATQCTFQPLALADIGRPIMGCAIEEDDVHWLPQMLAEQPFWTDDTLMLCEVYSGDMRLLLFTEPQRTAVLSELRSVLRVIERENITQTWI